MWFERLDWPSEQRLPFDRADVLGFRVAVLSEADVLEFVRDQVEHKRPSQIVTVNAEFVMLARRDPEFAAVIRSAALATPDGAGVVWAMRRDGTRQGRRVGGSDLIWSISEQAAGMGHRVFLLGAGEGIARQAGEMLVSRYPGLQIAGSHSGSPNLDEEASIVNLIRHSESDILFVAFGAPAQDLWIARNLASTGASVAIGVGGSFDYVAGRTRRAPEWMRDRGLDWLWRLLQQPWRWRRMLVLPAFVWAVLWEQRTVHSAKGYGNDERRRGADNSGP
jgi:N-acetylglucosaminyldiphosphoundecaprenol N-acetyl-beta-D-mannosaminyltransferase